MEPRSVRIAIRTGALVAMLFLYLPLLVIALNAFGASKIPTWPVSNFSTHWFRLAWGDEFARDALVNSLTVGLRAALLALILGTCIAFALSRFRFFGKTAVSLLFVLPIALPGIVTGMSLLSAIEYLDIKPSLWTVVAGHATFCIVVVYNNAVARLRRTSVSFEEASMDLGADGWQTFRHVTLPVVATALVAGGLLAFALSFDEVIVTTFTAGAQNTLPLWIFGNIRQGQSLPQTNVVVLLVIALTFIPVVLAQRLTRDTGVLRGAGAH
jgi:putative spermidine/putrescine transport system permease protein